MCPPNYSPRFGTDAGSDARRPPRERVSDDIAPDDVSLLGPSPPGSHASARSPEQLGAYGYAGQGYPIYGQRPPSDPYRDPPPREQPPEWYADPSSSAYAFGYTSSLRPMQASPPGRAPAGRHAGRGPRDYQRSDARLLEDVCDRLTEDDEVDASDISVEVHEGEVILSGSVVDRYIKRRAEHLAADVRGVIDVQNHLSTHKGLLRELGEKLTGEDPAEHHGHHGTGPQPAPGGT